MASSGSQISLGPAQPYWVPVRGKIRQPEDSADQTISLVSYKVLNKILQPASYLLGPRGLVRGQIFYFICFIKVHTNPIVFGRLVELCIEEKGLFCHFIPRIVLWKSRWFMWLSARRCWKSLIMGKLSKRRASWKDLIVLLRCTD